MLANRLSADGGHQVLLIEAGGQDNSLNIHIPLMVVNLLRDEKYTWPFMTEKQVHLNGKEQLWARGACSAAPAPSTATSMSAAIPAEYRFLEQPRLPGMELGRHAALFQAHGDLCRGEPDTRGKDGPINVTQLKNFDKLADAYLDANREAGFELVNDYNDGHYEGASYLQYSTRRAGSVAAARSAI